MNAKKSLENRIHGWFPKELFRASSRNDTIYCEWVSAGKFVKAFVGSISVLGLIVVALSIWFNIQVPLFALVMALLLILFPWLLYANFRGIQIKITPEELILNYGVLNPKHILMSDIESCERTKANFGKYLGVGIRYGIDDSLAYSTSFGDAVKINLSRERPFVFSSNNPEEICRTINQMKLQAGMQKQ